MCRIFSEPTEEQKEKLWNEFSSLMQEPDELYGYFLATIDEEIVLYSPDTKFKSFHELTDFHKKLFDIVMEREKQCIVAIHFRIGSFQIINWKVYLYKPIERIFL